MFCPYCGTKLPEESQFCSECGRAVGSRSSATQPVPGGADIKVDPVRPGLFARFLGMVFKIGLLIAVLCLAGTFISQLGKEPLEELISRRDWTYAAISQFDGTHVIRKGNTEYGRDITRIWDAIRSVEVRETEDSNASQVSDSENVSLFLMEAEGDESLYLAVTPDGKMYINNGAGVTRYFKGAESVYFAVKTFLPLGDETSLDSCLPTGNCSSLSISFYDQDMNEYDSVYIFDTEIIGESLQRLRQGTVKYGGGIDYEFEGYMAMVGITKEDGDYYFLQVYEDGSADIPQHNWVYGVSDAVDLYHALWDELRLLKGY